GHNLQQHSTNGATGASAPPLPQVDFLHQTAPNTASISNENHAPTLPRSAAPQSPRHTATSPAPFSPASITLAPIAIPTSSPTTASYGHAPPVNQHPAFAV